MANDFSAYYTQLLVMAQNTLRPNLAMPGLMNYSFDGAAKEHNETINIPIAAARAVSNVTPGPNHEANEDSTPSKIPLTLTEWKKAKFHIADDEWARMSTGQMPSQAAEAVKALATEINRFLLSHYTKFGGFHGTPGTTPFSDGTTVDATSIIRILNDQHAPDAGRSCVLGSMAQANALNVRAFQAADWRGNSETIQSGKLGYVLGMNWLLDTHVPTHTAGTLTGTITASSAAAGATSVTLTTDAGEAINLLEGDIVTFAGHTQTYVVDANLNVGASSGGAVLIYPALQTSLAGGETISVKGDHEVNLAFQQEAIAFATRPLVDVSFTGGQVVQSIRDPHTGITLRLTIVRQSFQTTYYFDLLYGAAVVRRSSGARLAG